MSSRDLRQHKMEEHLKPEDKNRFVCRKCFKSYGSGIELLNHLRWDHDTSSKSSRRSPPEDIPKRHKCDACDADFEFEESLKIHVDKAHAGPSPGGESAKETNLEPEAGEDDAARSAPEPGSSQAGQAYQASQPSQGSQGDSRFAPSKRLREIMKRRALKVGKKFVGGVSAVSKGRMFKRNPAKKKTNSMSPGGFCLVCKKNVHFFDSHMRLQHPGIYAFECNRCGSQFHSMKFRTAHYRGPCSKLEPEDDNNFKCEQCLRSFYTELTLKDHIAFFHENRKLHLCPTCGTEFAYKSQLDEHSCSDESQDSNPQPRDEPAVGDLRCESCERTFEAKQEFLDHRNYFHDKMKKHQCYKCGKEFGFKAGLDRHNYRAHCRIFNFVCKTCGLAFFSHILVGFFYDQMLLSEATTSSSKSSQTNGTLSSTW